MCRLNFQLSADLKIILIGLFNTLQNAFSWRLFNQKEAFILAFTTMQTSAESADSIFIIGVLWGTFHSYSYNACSSLSGADLTSQKLTTVTVTDSILQVLKRLSQWLSLDCMPLPLFCCVEQAHETALPARWSELCKQTHGPRGAHFNNNVMCTQKDPF